MEHTAVLIVGGGPVGLATALELARHGVRALLVERHDTTTRHPKTRNLNTRTMEIVHGWGPAVYDEIVGVNLPPGWTDQIVYTRTLLAGSGGATWVAAAQGTAKRLGVRVDAHAIGARGGWMDTDGSFGQRYGIEATGAVLVRPDGHVAFRAQRPAADPTRELSDALASVLGRRK